MASELQEAVYAWLTDDAWETRLILKSQSHLLLLFRRDEHQPWLELGHKRSGAEQRGAFTKLGLARKRWAQGPSAWGRRLDTQRGTSAIAEVVAQLWRDVCDAEAYELSVLAQRERPPDNARLVDAMRAAAQVRDDATRQQLYAAVVNAALLVPIDPATAQGDVADQKPLSFGSDPHGIPTWAAFSDWDALRQWQPAGHPFGTVQGTEFLAHVHDQGRCTVRINPDGVVGGEFYPGEVKMMVEAVRRFYRQTLS